jgi:hypothetical protein
MRHQNRGAVTNLHTAAQNRYIALHKKGGYLDVLVLEPGAAEAALSPQASK